VSFANVMCVCVCLSWIRVCVSTNVMCVCVCLSWIRVCVSRPSSLPCQSSCCVCVCVCVCVVCMPVYVSAYGSLSSSSDKYSYNYFQNSQSCHDRTHSLCTCIFHSHVRNASFINLTCHSVAFSHISLSLSLDLPTKREQNLPFK